MKFLSIFCETDMYRNLCYTAQAVYFRGHVMDLDYLTLTLTPILIPVFHVGMHVFKFTFQSTL
jgi:hypothetical protein